MRLVITSFYNILFKHFVSNDCCEFTIFLKQYNVNYIIIIVFFKLVKNNNTLTSFVVNQFYTKTAYHYNFTPFHCVQTRCAAEKS